ncbi:MAG: hypothetical protein ACQEXJ_21520 [Myxococcota bacterium]
MQQTPTAQEQVEFLQNVQRLLSEGRRPFSLRARRTASASQRSVWRFISSMERCS